LGYVGRWKACKSNIKKNWKFKYKNLDEKYCLILQLVIWIIENFGKNNTKKSWKSSGTKSLQ
jgi:hypothetical protein